MSVYTAGEIVVWLVLAAALGVALGWLLGSRRGAAPGTGTGSTTSADRRTVPGPETRYGSSDPVRPRQAARSDREPERAAPGSVGPFRGSALPGPGGGSPGPGYEVKANVDSLTYYLPGSPAHARVTADVWFKDAEAARTAGFRPPPSQA